MSLSGITFSGLGSGIDTESIIQNLLRVESIPVQRLQRRQAALQASMSVFGEFRAQLRSLANSASAFNVPGAFEPMRAASSNADVAGVTASSQAVAGSYNLSVYQLARAQKLSSTGQSSATAALGLTGTFTVNGRQVSLSASDSLTAIAQKINGAGAEVAATVIDGGPGQAFLSLTGTRTGAAHKIDLADTSGSVLGTLGFLATQVRESVANGFRTSGFDSATATLASLADFDGAGPTQVTVNGAQVTIDPATDTLQTLAAKLGAVPGVSASVVEVSEFGRTTYRLEVTGTAGAPVVGDEGDIMLNLGALRRTSEVLAAQDARYAIDGLALRSDRNVVTGVIPGVTLTLKRAAAGTPETATVTVSRDTEGVKALAKTFVTSFNSVLGFVRQNSQFDAETFISGPLFGDPVAGQVEQSITSLVFASVPGLGGPYTNLTQLGFSLDAGGNLQLDEAAFEAALTANPGAVARMFHSAGRSTNDQITYVSSSARTRASQGDGFVVNITQIARKAEFQAANPFTSPTQVQETLTFRGSHIGNDYRLVINPGATLQETIDRINSDARLRDLVVASNDGGRLAITSLRYGTVGNFTVFSDVSAGDGRGTGVGLEGEGTTTNGQDVAGTINGEEATGSGQFLTGRSGNANTDGLQIQYTGTALGAVGHIVFTKGIGSQTFDLMDSFLAATSGLLSASEAALESQYRDLGDNIASLQSRLEQRETDLRRRFTAMEEALARLQSQSAQLGAILNRTRARE
jgi:flagellar hook-associated protein 2